MNSSNHNSREAEPAEALAHSKGTKSCKLFARLIAIVCLIAVIVVAFTVLEAHKKLGSFLEWTEGHKAPGFFIFIGTYALATILFIPAALLSVGAGYTFGIFIGAIAVWFGAVIGQTVGFLAGRHLFREGVSSFTERFQLWRGLEIAAKEEGWKIVSLLRLAPVIPYTVLNYILGITAVSFLEYFIASAIFIIPGVFLFVYLGSLANNIKEITSGDSPVDSKTTIILACVSGVVIVLVVVLTGRYARKALKRLVLMESQQPTAMELDQLTNGPAATP